MPDPQFRDVEVAGTVEPWTEIRLIDGTLVRVRLNITKVRAVLGEDGQQIEGDGKPLYDIRWVAAVDVTPPALPTSGRKQ